MYSFGIKDVFERIIFAEKYGEYSFRKLKLLVEVKTEFV